MSSSEQHWHDLTKSFPDLAPFQDRIEPYRIGLILTEQCNLTCKHCWFNSGPGQILRMEMEHAFSFIDQAKTIPTVEWISITGGEPFLLQEMLRRVISFAKNSGFHTECVTNCFWADSEKKAARILERLQRVGLEVINISTDDFHQDQLPFERVSNCYKASQQLGIKTVIMCTISRSSMLTVRRIASLLGSSNIHVIRKEVPHQFSVSALAVESGFIPVGRGTQVPEDERVIGDGSTKGPCHVALRDVSISPSGSVLPCCSALATNEAFRIGNARREGLLSIIQRAGRIGPFKILMNEGPQSLQRWAAGRYTRGYVNRCDLCYEVMADPFTRKWLRMEGLPFEEELEKAKQ